MSRFPESFGTSSPEKQTDTAKDPKKKKLGQFVAGNNTKSKAEKPAPADQPLPPKRFNESITESILKHTKQIEQEPKAKKQPEQKETTDTPEPVETLWQPTDVSSEQLQSQSREKPAAEEQIKPEVNEQPKDSKEKADEQPDDPEYREMLAQTLRENQTGGEVVVNLDGNLAEHVVSLRSPAAEAEVPATNEEQPAEYQAATPNQPAAENAPEPQHPAHAGSNEVPPPVENGGGGGEVPPTEPPEQGGGAAESPDPERQPDHNTAPESQPIQPEQTETRVMQPGEAEVLYGSGGAAMPNASPSVSPSERPATKQELDQAFARNAQIHEQRGVLSGLLFGTWLANRGLRRRQKRGSKEQRKQGSQLERLAQQLNVVSNLQERRKINTEQRFKTVDKRFENLPKPEQSGKPAKAERLPVPVAAPNEQLKIPENHHVETSAWHSIEVDNKTGKAVETPTFQYGHEYYRERAHESGPVDHRNAVAGELAVIAATGASVVSDSKPGASSQQQIPSATQQGPPSSMRDKAKDKAKSALGAIKESGSSSQAGPIWPWAVALLAIVIVLALLIH